MKFSIAVGTRVLTALSVGAGVGAGAMAAACKAGSSTGAGAPVRTDTPSWVTASCWTFRSKSANGVAIVLGADTAKPVDGATPKFEFEMLIMLNVHLEMTGYRQLKPFSSKAAINGPGL
jgi:hypothetical protein